MHPAFESLKALHRSPAPIQFVECENDFSSPRCVIVIIFPFLTCPKGFDVALEVLAHVVKALRGKRSTGAQDEPCAPSPVRVTWVCQRLPGPDQMASMAAATSTTMAEGTSALIMALYVLPPQASDVPDYILSSPPPCWSHSEGS